MATRNVWIPSGRAKPGATWRIATKVRIISPDTTSSVKARATCDTTSALRVRCRAGPSLLDRPPSLSARRSAPRTSRRQRDRTTYRSAPRSRMVKSSTVRSMPISSTRGSSAGPSSQHTERGFGERQADCAAGKGQQDAFGQQHRARDARDWRRAPRASRAPAAVPRRG